MSEKTRPQKKMEKNQQKTDNEAEDLIIVEPDSQFNYKSQNIIQQLVTEQIRTILRIGSTELNKKDTRDKDGNATAVDNGLAYINSVKQLQALLYPYIEKPNPYFQMAKKQLEEAEKYLEDLLDQARELYNKNIPLGTRIKYGNIRSLPPDSVQAIAYQEEEVKQYIQIFKLLSQVCLLESWFNGD